MKKNVFLVSCSLLCMVFVLAHTRPTVPCSSLLFSTLEAGAFDDVTFFYTTPSADTIMPFSLNATGFHPVSTRYTFYTEGFIPTPLSDRINHALRDTPYAGHYLHDYLLLDHIAIVAFPGDLSSIFIIDLEACKAYPLHFEPEQDLGFMYVSHMRLVDDTLIIAGGKAHALTSFVYTVDLPTATVIKRRELMTSMHTRYEQDFTILRSGTCVFLLEDALCLYDPFSDTCTTHPLNFTPTQVISYGNAPLLLHEEVDKLRVALPDSQIATPLELPLSTYYLVDALIHQHHTLLTLILLDPTGTRFSHYICTYHLPDGKWVAVHGVSPLNGSVLTKLVQ